MFDGKFKNYFVINAPVTIHPGQQVKLTEDQAKRRKHVAKKIKGDIWEAVSCFQFKAGEIFGYAGDMNKKLADQMIDPEKIEPEPEPEEKTEDFDNLEILTGMSDRQLQYFARVKCDLKLQLKDGAEEMIKSIKNAFAKSKK